MAKDKKSLVKWLLGGFACTFVVFFLVFAAVTGKMPVIFGSGGLDKNKGDEQTSTVQPNGDGTQYSSTNPRFTFTNNTLTMEISTTKTDFLINPDKAKIIIQEYDSAIIGVVINGFAITITAKKAGTSIIKLTAEGVEGSAIATVTVIDNTPAVDNSVYALDYEYTKEEGFFDGYGKCDLYCVTFFVTADGKKVDKPLNNLEVPTSETTGFPLVTGYVFDCNCIDNQGNILTLNDAIFTVTFTAKTVNNLGSSVNLVVVFAIQ